MSDRHVMPHDEWDELAAGFALHALEPDEEALFARHLAGCAECTATLHDHDLVAAQLGSLAGDDDSAPPWSRMRGGIVGSAPVPSLEQARARRRPPRLLSAAAAAVVLAAVGVATWRLTNTSPTQASQAIAKCEHTAGCNVVKLRTSTGATPGVVLVSDGRATMVPLDMKPPAADRTYVLWQLLRKGSPAPVGEFRATKGEVSAPLATSYADTAAFAVSLEPAGPTPSQPTEVLAVGQTPV
jgi:anti-sigma-K factor RskA